MMGTGEREAVGTKTAPILMPWEAAETATLLAFKSSTPGVYVSSKPAGRASVTRMAILTAEGCQPGVKSMFWGLPGVGRALTAVLRASSEASGGLLPPPATRVLRAAVAAAALLGAKLTWMVT